MVVVWLLVMYEVVVVVDLLIIIVFVVAYLGFFPGGDLPAA